MFKENLRTLPTFKHYSTFSGRMGRLVVLNATVEQELAINELFTAKQWTFNNLGMDFFLFKMELLQTILSNLLCCNTVVLKLKKIKECP